MREVEELILDYVDGVREVYTRFPVREVRRAIDVLLDAYRNRKTIVTMGNGGSGLIASHVVQDMNKHTITSDSKDVPVTDKRFKVLALNEEIGTLTAWSNDRGYEDAYAQMLVNWIGKGDVVIGISSSGNSENIVRALTEAKKRGAVTIGLTGHQGGKIRRVVDICVVIPTDTNYYAEDVQGSVVHIWCDIIRSCIREELGE